MTDNDTAASRQLGDVGKCPQCGKQSRSYSHGCSQCGFGRPSVDELTAALAQSRERAATYANEIGTLTAENARVRQQRDELREQVFAQKPVVKAAEAWAEAWEELKGDDTVPYVIAQPSAALHDAIEQHRLMDMALTSARAEHAAATR